jgi:hypothetical protein
MTVVSTQDFVTNHNRYFDLAIDEQVVVNRGDYSFRIVLDTAPREQKILQPDDDLRRAITAEELLEGVHEDINRFFASIGK